MPPLIDECDPGNLEDDFEDSMAPGNSLSFHTPVRSRAGAEIISPLETEEGFEEITKSSQSGSSQSSKWKPRKSAMLFGLKSDNIIDIDDDEETDIDDNIPASSNVLTRAQVHGRPQNEIVYDVKHHPLDEYMKPKGAAKVKSRYGIKNIGPEGILYDNSDHLSGSETEIDTYDPRTKSKKPPRPHMSPTRRSSRISHKKNVAYDSNVHPQDNEIEGLGDVALKQEPGNQESGNEEPSRKRTRVGSFHTSTLPGDRDSDSTPPRNHVNHPQVVITPNNLNRHATEPVLRYAEELDMFDLQPGEHYFPHEKESLFKKKLAISGGEFTIYEESEEVQRATLAQAPASCRHFDDFPKENVLEVASSESSDDHSADVVVENGQTAVRTELLSQRPGNGNDRSALEIMDAIYGDELTSDVNPFI